MTLTSTPQRRTAPLIRRVLLALAASLAFSVFATPRTLKTTVSLTIPQGL
jgi:hypothetical protein